MNIHPLIPEDYPVIDSYMQELHDLHVQGRPDLFIPASHIYSEADFREITCLLYTSILAVQRTIIASVWLVQLKYLQTIV